MTTRNGTVWWRDQRVGSLHEDHRRLLHFRYDDGWLAQGGFSISVGLPTSIGDKEQEAHSYFSGLLPEGQARLRISRQLGLSTDDDAGLLLAIGGDCAGALSILSEDEKPGEEAGVSDALTQDDFHQIIRTHGVTPTLSGEHNQRFSLAGAQEKFTIVKDKSGFRWPNAQRPSTHLIKFETVPHVCFAEYMATRIARSIGLSTVNVDYCLLPESDTKSAEKTPYLMLERYDRVSETEHGEVKRLHQEDMTQALAYPSTLKYEHDGGPSLRDVMTLVRETVDNPVRAINQLRDWQIFNTLVGNWDGHGKNLAFLYEPHSAVPSLAPFYDLVSIEYINTVGGARYAREMAFAVGGEYVPERIGRQAWQAFASELGIPARVVLDRVQTMAEELPSHADQALTDFQNQHGANQVHDSLLHLIEKRCRWVLQGIR